MAEHFADGEDRARGAQHPVPTNLAVSFDDGGQFESRGESRAVEGLLGEFPVSEEACGGLDASHVEAVEFQGFVAPADDALGASAPDIEDEKSSLDAGGYVGDPCVDQAGFFASGDDLDGVSQGLGEGRLDFGAVARFAEGVGGNGPDRARGHVA